MSSYIDLAPSGTNEKAIHVNSEVMALKDEMIKHRRWFHSNPEFSFKGKSIYEHILLYLFHDIFYKN